MRKLASFLCGGILCGATVFGAEPAEKEKIICVVEANCVPDTIEVTFDGDTQSVLEYATPPVDPIKATIISGVQSEGVQGWSYGIAHDQTALSLTRADFAGTDAEANFSGGFNATSLKDIETCEDATCTARSEGGGWISAIVLSFTENITLPLGRRSLATADYTLLKDVGADGTIIEITNKLAKKKSPPADINVTVSGASKKWTTGIDGWIKAISVQEICDNGIDDDGDQLIDCADPDCAGAPNCVETICDDNLDNDGDGLIDCADPDCAPSCPQVEICDNGVDDDGDQLVDCADPDCCGQGTCDPCPSGLNLALDAEGADRVGATNVLKVCAAELPRQVEVAGLIEPVGDPLVEGAAGWSISVEHDPAVLDIQSGGGFPTITGTDAAALLSGGFEKTEVVDPAKNGGRAGFVSAVVLSFTEAIALDPTKPQTIVRSMYTVKAGATLPSTINFEDGLRGVGQPVQNVITVKGDSVFAKQTIGLEVQEKPAGECGVVPSTSFVRGDANDDGKVNIADPIWIINELVRQGPKTACQDAADANDDGLVDLSDSMYLIQWRFLGGTQPLAPFPACGTDPKDDSLACPEGSVTHCPQG